MSKVKAIIKLANGNVGFYDNLTQIHLTILSPIANVYEGMNVTNLQRGVSCKTIEVLEGSLYTSEPEIIEPPIKEDAPMEEVTPPKEEVESSPMEELTPAEEVEKESTETEEKPEQEVKETKTKTTKKRTSKKTTSSTEESK